MQGYRVEIITPMFEVKNGDHSISIREIEMPLADLYKAVIKEDNSLSRTIFRINRIVYAFKLARYLRSEECIFWTRDVSMTLVFHLLGIQTICEVHRRVNGILNFIMKMFSKNRTCTIVFISSYLQKKSGVKKENSIVAGMAVNFDDLVPLPKEKIDQFFVVGYLGSIQSSGIRLSLNQLFNTARKFEEDPLRVVFRFVGISLDDLLLEERMSLPSNVQFIGRVPRERVMEEMDKFSVGLVLYPDTTYFQDSFPIKIVEYAARRVPIIASNTFAHRTLLGNDKALYFSLDSNNSLYECLNELIENSEKAQAMTQAAFNWVKSLTYENRVKTVLDFHNKRNVSK